jgi:hypothetical protein
MWIEAKPAAMEKEGRKERGRTRAREKIIECERAKRGSDGRKRRKTKTRGLSTLREALPLCGEREKGRRASFRP